MSTDTAPTDQDRLLAELNRLEKANGDQGVRAQVAALAETVKMHCGYFRRDVAEKLSQLGLDYIEQSDVTSADCDGIHADTAAEITEK